MRWRLGWDGTSTPVRLRTAAVKLVLGTVFMLIGQNSRTVAGRGENGGDQPSLPGRETR